MTQKPIIRYHCVHSPKYFSTEEEAIKHDEEAIRQKEKATKREVKKLERKNSIRMEAEKLSDIRILLIRKFKEYWDLDLTIDRFPNMYGTKITNSHFCPVDGVCNFNRVDTLPLGYCGWLGKFIASVPEFNKKYQDKDFKTLIHHDIGSIFSISLGDLLKFFKGVNLGSGSYGEDLEAEGTFFIDDFPRIKQKHDKFLELGKEYTGYSEQMCQVKVTSAIEAKLHPDVLELYEQVAFFKAKLSDIDGKITEKVQKEANRLYAESYKAPTFDPTAYPNLAAEFSIAIRGLPQPPVEVI